MPSLLNGLSAMGSGIAAFAGTAGLEQQRSDLARQSAILADQLATTRETALEGQRQAGQAALQTSSQTFQGAQTDKTLAAESARQQAALAVTQAEGAATRAAEAARQKALLDQPPEIIRTLRALGALPPAGATDTPSASAATPTTAPASTATGGAPPPAPSTSGTQTPASGSVTPPIGGSAPNLAENLINKTLGLPELGSEAATRRAIAQDVNADPDFKYKTAGQKAAEVENRFAMAAGHRGVGLPGSEIANREAIAGDVNADPNFANATPGQKAAEIESRFRAATASGSLGARGEVQFKRVAVAATEAAQAAANIMELPSASSTGIFAGRGQGSGLLNAAKETITHALTSQDVQSYNTIVPGISRSLATIEASGLAPPGSFATSMDALTLKEGDTELTKMRKMAEVRQIVEKGMEPNLADPRIPEPQKAQLRGVIAQIQEAIPFTHHDITMLQRSNNPNATMADVMNARGLGPQGASASATPTSGDKSAPMTVQQMYGGTAPESAAPALPRPPAVNPDMMRLWGQ